MINLKIYYYYYHHNYLLLTAVFTIQTAILYHLVQMFYMLPIPRIFPLAVRIRNQSAHPPLSTVRESQ
jgi:hypothetical protein